MIQRTENITASIPQAKGVRTTKQVRSDQATASFKKTLKQQIGERKGIDFSAHAEDRLAVRQISLSQQELLKIEDGVNRASQKGASESLLLMDDLAFIVSVKNRTVITVIDGQNMKDNVFTNIDSAIIV
ncbi:MAG: TIGR02530 family flagellar biosynthesis protein [Candidatus Poribacteria bacterium]|jgi:flagellar operon protein|nr:TIGR02530 family flagellar biosynthesis protein [Candidatus Poribacteria bacterium]MDP6962369.1 TIGR02530 family flagellar biosynthesis protein [Dehalococcoidia bacterium]